MKIEKAGEYKLKAVYTPSGNAELSHEVAFSVKPVQVSIFPSRKVLTYSQGLTAPLQTKVEFNGKPPIEDSEQSIDLGDGVTAKVTNVDWKTITNPSDGVCDLKIEPNLLAPTVEFKAPGVLTALATVTVVISKEVKKQPNELAKPKVVEETFVLPAVRADLWAVRNPLWLELGGYLRKKAIVKTGRTFEPASGTFLFFDRTYEWSKDFGLSKPITLVSALPAEDVSPVTCEKIGFSWKTSEGQTSNQSSFVAVFQKSGQASVELTNILNFNDAGQTLFERKDFPLQVFKLDELITSHVDPSSFTITIGETQQLTFIVEPKETPVPPPPSLPAFKKGLDVIYLLDRDYKLELVNVDWFEDQTPTKQGIESQPYNFTPLKPGLVNGSARGWYVIVEVAYPNDTYNSSSDISWYAIVQDIVVKFFINNQPIHDRPCYLGEYVTLSYKAYKQGNQEIR